MNDFPEVSDYNFWFFQKEKEYIINNFGIKSLQMQMRNTMEKDIQSFMRPFVEMCSFSGVQFPLLGTTYSLWRNVCYKQMQWKYGFEKGSSEERELKRAFIKVSERKLFKQFELKLNGQIDGQKVGWRKIILQADELKTINSPEYNELLFQYCELIYQLEFQIELFYDLVSIPYSDIYQQGKQYLLNEKFKSSFYAKKEQSLADRICGKLGRNMLAKGLGKLSQNLISTKLIYNLTGILTTINPLALLTSLSISHLLHQHQRSSHQKQLIDQITYLITLIKSHLTELKQTYQKCLCLIEGMAELDVSEGKEMERERKRFYQVLEGVMVEDWLRVKVTRQQEGWEFVELTNNTIYQFQHLELSQSQQEKTSSTTNSSSN